MFNHSPIHSLLDQVFLPVVISPSSFRSDHLNTVIDFPTTPSFLFYFLIRAPQFGHQYLIGKVTSALSFG